MNYIVFFTLFISTNIKKYKVLDSCAIDNDNQLK